jgi:hypothetical protein
MRGWTQGCGRPFPEPCMCGAEDCPRCFPFSRSRAVECPECGAEVSGEPGVRVCPKCGHTGKADE